MGINDFTIPVSGFSDPYITSCYLDDDDKIFCNLFHNVELRHYMFIYSRGQNNIISEVVTKDLECSKKNFPYKSFYNDQDDEVYTFYRCGQSFSVML